MKFLAAFFSIAALVSGAGLYLMCQPYLGSVLACYAVAVVVAPLALAGFYRLHDMDHKRWGQEKRSHKTTGLGRGIFCRSIYHEKYTGIPQVVFYKLPVFV